MVQQIGRLFQWMLDMCSIYFGKIGVLILVWLMHLVCTLKQLKYTDQISWVVVHLHMKQSCYPKWSECLSS